MKSLHFDLRLATIPALPIHSRANFFRDKVLSLLSLAKGSPFSVSVGNATIRIHSASDLGTLQACIVDVYDELLHPRIASDEPTVADLGANIGQWTAALKLYIPTATVFAVEPDPRTFDRLIENVRNLSGVECAQCALGSRSGWTVLYRQPLSVMSTTCVTIAATRCDAVEVPLHTVDELLDGRAPTEILKIDVEGSELEVLHGAAETLKRAAVLVIEISLSRGSGNGLDVLSELKRIRPSARILKFGRPLGARHNPACQDVVVALS